MLVVFVVVVVLVWSLFEAASERTVLVVFVFTPFRLLLIVGFVLVMASSSVSRCCSVLHSGRSPDGAVFRHHKFHDPWHDDDQDAEQDDDDQDE